MWWAEKEISNKTSKFTALLLLGPFQAKMPCLHPVLNSPPPYQAPEKKISDMGPLKSHFPFRKYICLLFTAVYTE